MGAHHVTRVWSRGACLSSPNGYVRGNTVSYAPGCAPLVRALPTRNVGIALPRTAGVPLNFNR